MRESLEHFYWMKTNRPNKQNKNIFFREFKTIIWLVCDFTKIWNGQSIGYRKFRIKAFFDQHGGMDYQLDMSVCLISISFLLFFCFWCLNWILNFSLKCKIVLRDVNLNLLIKLYLTCSQFCSLPRTTKPSLCRLE